MSVKKILLVDNEKETIDLLTGIFNNEGFQLELAGSGKEAIGKIANNRPDLILLETKVPGMDGWEICMLLKNNEGTRGIPIVFISAEGEIHKKLQAFQIGASGFIRKPFSAEELLRQVEQLVKKEE